MYSGVQKLLDATGQRMVDVGTVDGHSPLHVAAVNGLRQIAQVLVETVSYKLKMLAVTGELDAGESCRNLGYLNSVSV